MRICEVDGCGRTHYARGWCTRHYQRWLTLGSVEDRDLRRRTNGIATVRDAEGHKRCIGCDKWKAEAAFSTHAQTSDGLQVRCRKCVNAATRKLKYGLSADDLKARLTEQCFACAICGSDITARHLVDHDHSCCPSEGNTCGGCVRGLLCDGCNLGLGAFKDNVAALQMAIYYLEKYRGK